MCSDAIHLSIKPRRHVGGILNVKCKLKSVKSENSYAKVIRRPCNSTNVGLYICRIQHFASIHKFTNAAETHYTSNMAAISIVYKITQPSPDV